MIQLIITIRPESNYFHDWQFILFSLILVSLAYLNTGYHVKLRSVFKSVRNNVQLRQMMREDHILPKSHVFLAIQFCLLLGFIISITCIHLSWLNVNEIILFGLCATAVFFIYIIKRLSIIFIKWLTDGDYTLSEYYYRVFAINRLLGIILFPMVLLLAVSDKELATAYLTCCWVIVGIGILWRVVSGALAAFQSGVSILYIFFYICTLELFPILAGYKTILYLGTGVFHFN